LALAAEEYGESFFRNGATMSGVIEAERDPGEPAVARMRASFARDHQGLRNSHKPGFLFGAKWTPLSIPNDAAQFLETRKYQLGEIARIFRVPPHKIGDLDRATFSNIEHQAIEWVTDGVIPTTARIEAAVLAAGILDVGQHLRFNFSGLLRGDTVSRYAAYAVGRQWGWLSVDDIRALEDQNPLPDGRGQVYLEPMNMTPVGQEDELKIPEQVSAAAALVAAGYDPAAALTVVGLDPIRHLGALTPARTEG
jgi:HK97 family phage portal protein